MLFRASDTLKLFLAFKTGWPTGKALVSLPIDVCSGVDVTVCTLVVVSTIFAIGIYLLTTRASSYSRYFVLESKIILTLYTFGIQEICITFFAVSDDFRT